MPTVAPFDPNTPVVQSVRNKETGKTELSAQMSAEFYNWQTLNLLPRVNNTANRIGTVTLTAQAAAIGTTAVPMPALTEGVFRVTTYLRITQAATVSSSVALTITGTDGGVNCPQAGAAVTGNTTATVQGLTFQVRSDQAVPISYAVAYASVGGTPAQFRLEIRVEAMDA